MDSGSILQVVSSIKQANGDALGDRIRKAAGLWYAGGVSYCGDNLWMVDSRSQPGLRYVVTFNLAWHCTCEDHVRRAPEIEFYGGVQKTCLHIIAAALSWAVDSPEACERPHPQPVVTLPGWLVKDRPVDYDVPARRAAHQDSADMGIDARDAAPPAWFGDNIDIESYLG